MIGGLSALGDTQFWRKPPKATLNTSAELKFIWLILLGSIPTGIIAVVFQDTIGILFDEVRLVSITLILTGVILQLPRLRREKAGESRYFHRRIENVARTTHRNRTRMANHTRHLPFRHDNLIRTFFGGFPQKPPRILLPALNSRDTRCGCTQNPRGWRHRDPVLHCRNRNARPRLSLVTSRCDSYWLY